MAIQHFHTYQHRLYAVFHVNKIMSLSINSGIMTPVLHTFGTELYPLWWNRHSSSLEVEAWSQLPETLPRKLQKQPYTELWHSRRNELLTQLSKTSTRSEKCFCCTLKRMWSNFYISDNAAVKGALAAQGERCYHVKLNCSSIQPSITVRYCSYAWLLKGGSSCKTYLQYNKTII